mgnify:CR=1 FL=1|tara:strand:- start:2530 stop:3027 length:498 start_codon:yes stop_codon:yes gene_type:complete
MHTYKIVLFLCCLQLSLVAQQKQSDVSIMFNSPSFKNKMYYMAGYYGKYTTLLDSAKATNSGQLLFENTKKYIEGIYMLVDEDKNIVTEFIMDTNQQYSISLNLANPEKNIVLNSETNTRFFEFNALLKQNNQQKQKLVKQLAQTTSEKDIKNIKRKIRTLNITI